MNLTHLKYALEVAKYRSINKAADKMFMGQPNLSRAIRDLEESLGIQIFKRTPRGIEVTPPGEEFLSYARNILRQVDEVEALYRHGKKTKSIFSVSVPRAAYMSYAFSRFSAKVTQEVEAGQLELFYKETNSSKAISNILNADYHLGIIRYAVNYDKYFREMLEEKNLVHETIAEFTYVLAMSATHPLAKKKSIDFEDLAPYTEIAHADPYVPFLSMAAVKKEELPDNVNKRIFIFERASQFDLLCKTSGTFMWVSPMPDELLQKYNLIQRPCACNQKRYRDVLIYKKDYTLSKLDQQFIDEVQLAKSVL